MAPDKQAGKNFFAAVIKDLEGLKPTNGYDKYVLLYKAAMCLNSADRTELDNKIDGLRKSGGLRAHAVRETKLLCEKINNVSAKPENKNLDMEAMTKRQRDMALQAVRNPKYAMSLLDQKIAEARRGATQTRGGRGHSSDRRGYRGGFGPSNQGNRQHNGYSRDSKWQDNRASTDRYQPYHQGRGHGGRGRGHSGRAGFNNQNYDRKCESNFPLTTPQKYFQSKKEKSDDKSSNQKSEAKTKKVMTTEQAEILNAKMNTDDEKIDVDKLWDIKMLQLERLAQLADKAVDNN